MHMPNPEADNAADLSVNPRTLPTPQAVRANLEKQVAEKRGSATPEQIARVVELFEHMHAYGVKTFAEAGKRFGRDGSLFSKIANGVYTADLAPFCASAEYHLEQQRKFGVRAAQPLVETSTYRTVVQQVNFARACGQIVRLYGPSHCGKTRGFKACAERMPNTYYLRTPAGAPAHLFMRECLVAVGRSPNTVYHVARETFFNRLGPSSVLIIDDFQEALVPMRRATVSLVLEAAERRQCGIVLGCTYVAQEAFRDPVHAVFLEQIVNRSPTEIRLTGEPTAEDLRGIVAAYGFPGLAEHEEGWRKAMQVGKGDSLGRLCKFLVQAKVLADTRKEEPDPEHFLITMATNEAAKRAVVKGGGR